MASCHSSDISPTQINDFQWSAPHLIRQVPQLPRRPCIGRQCSRAASCPPLQLVCRTLRRVRELTAARDNSALADIRTLLKR